MSKGESRTNVAVRESRRKTNLLRNAKAIAGCDAAVAEWELALPKLLTHRCQDTPFAQEGLQKACYIILPQEVLILAQLKFDEPFEPDGFHEKLESVFPKRPDKPTP